MTALYGLLAEFATPRAVVAAARRVREAGYRRLDAFTPFPVEGLADAVGFRDHAVPLITLLGGLVGGAGAFGMQAFATVTSYPLDVGGRPLFSWPSYVPITFELTVLGAALSALFSMLWLNRLPQPHHPLFGVPEFDLASRDRFFLFVRATDPRFEPAATRALLEGLSPVWVGAVPAHAPGGDPVAPPADEGAP